MRVKQFFIFLLLAAFIGSTISCKSSRRKNRCNTCPTWDQVDLAEDTQ